MTRATAKPREPRLSHDRRILFMAFASALPGALISLIFLWTGDFTPKVQWTLTVVILAFCLGFAFALRERVVLPLQTLSNLLAALGEGDFSIRARGARGGDPLGEVMIEVNTLVETLRHQRLDALEATTLLRKVMAEIEVAVFTFDEERELKFVNRAGARLLAQTAERTLGRRAEELGLEDCLDGDAPRVINTAFPGGVGRWEIRRSSFRQGGRPHELLVLSDLSQPLREEERQAFQRLIRVIGHEMNNSLAPIKSIAGSLATITERDPLPSDWRDDVQRGLGVIASRSESLSRFMSAYARLAKLPPPKLAPLDVGAVIDRVVTLEKGHNIQIARRPAADDPGGRRSARAAADQPDPERRGCGPGDRRRRPRRLAAAARIVAAGDGAVGRRRRPGPVEYRQPLRAVLHHQAGRVRHRARAQPADRRSARRQPDAREPGRPHRLPRQPAPARSRRRSPSRVEAHAV